MKVLVLGSKDHGSKNDPAIVASGIQSEDLLTEIVYWEDLVFYISTGSVFVKSLGKDVFDENPGLIITMGWYKKQKGYRDVGYAFGLVAQRHNVPIWNSEILMQRSTTKLSCMVQLALNDISVPTSVFSLEDPSYMNDQPLPFIAKDPAASRGESNHLISAEDERRGFVETGGGYLVQPFLPNDHDLRVICFDGRPQLVLKRSRAEASETHLNNTSQGGSSEWLDLSQIPSELLTISEKICKIMGREMAGIDFIPNAESPYHYSCLEVNAIPQLTSGVDVEKKMAALKSTINRYEGRT